MFSTRYDWAWHQSLGFRILALLSIVLLPIGLIAVLQTQEVTTRVEEKSQQNILALSERAAGGQHAPIQAAFGAALVIGATAVDLQDNPGECSAFLERIVSITPIYAFVAFIPPDGQVTCSSLGEAFDATVYDNFDASMSERTPSVMVNRAGPLSGESVLIVSEPIRLDGEFYGFISISIPHERLAADLPGRADDRPRNILLLNSRGEIVSASSGFEIAQEERPAERDLARIATEPAGVFQGSAMNGAPYIYGSSTLIPDVLTALAVWDSDTPAARQLSFAIPPSLFPIFMWVASLIVAYFALDRLVVRQIRNLSDGIRLFALDRRSPFVDNGHLLSGELTAIERDFHRMAEDVIYDEAKLEGAIKEKDVLLKEVHHRVKNNLQLISSIMNMQLRKTTNSETRQILSRLQDRVQSLATVHRKLYQTENLDKLDAGYLVRDLVTQTARLGTTPDQRIDLQFDIDAIVMFPDQAVPLSLFLTETAINAFKYADAEGDETPWVKVRFVLEAPGQALLEISNSLGPLSMETKEGEMSGFGSQLIRAFSMQLRAKTDITQQDGVYRVVSRFNVEDFEPEYREEV